VSKEILNDTEGRRLSGDVERLLTKKLTGISHDGKEISITGAPLKEVTAAMIKKGWQGFREDQAWAFGREVLVAQLGFGLTGPGFRPAMNPSEAWVTW
jgi:hypothetical protein